MKYKKGDEVRVIASKKRLDEHSIYVDITGQTGIIRDVGSTYYGVDIGSSYWFLEDQDLELAYRAVPVSGVGTPTITLSPPDGKLEMVDNTMTLERFNTLVDYIVEQRIKKVMCAKSKEYAQGGNKLHNFDKAGDMRGITPMEALRGMKLKHEVSIEDMLDGLKEGKTYPRELWEEKFTDNINYQILEWAILARDNGWSVPVDRTKPVPGGY